MSFYTKPWEKDIYFLLSQQVMNEKMLYHISLGMTIIGLLFLFFYAERVSTANIETQELIPKKPIIMQGKISSISTHEKAIFLEILREKIEPTTIILFANENTTLNAGDFIEVRGRVEEYNGKAEIIADKVVQK